MLSPSEQEQVSNVLEDDAQVMSDDQLQAQIAGQPVPVQDEIVRINTDARNVALQVALLVPLLAGLLGLVNSFRMVRQPDVAPQASTEGFDWG